MLVFTDATTPKKTILGVIELLNAEIARYQKTGITGRLQRDRDQDTARANALRLIVRQLADCNLMHQKDEEDGHNEAEA
jgi:hypothetical protein